MTTPLIRPELVLSSDGPFLAAAELTQRESRATSSHSHARGQLMGALSGLVSVGRESYANRAKALFAHFSGKPL